MKRLKSTERQQEIIITAADLVRVGGFSTLTIAGVAEKIGVHRTLVHHYFGSREILLDHVIRYARRLKDEKILAEALRWEKGTL